MQEQGESPWSGLLRVFKEGYSCGSTGARYAGDCARSVGGVAILGKGNTGVAERTDRPGPTVLCSIGR